MRLTILFLLLNLSCIAQKKDTTQVPKRDTVLFFLVVDTLRVSYLYEHGKNIRKADGFVLLRGFKDISSRWIEQPMVAGIIDKKKKPAKKVIQILN